MSLEGGLHNQVVCQKFLIIIVLSRVLGHNCFILKQIPPDFAQQLLHTSFCLKMKMSVSIEPIS